MNKVQLIGNVSKDLITRDFSTSKLASFTMATNERFTNKNNEEQTQTCWHNVVAWGKVAEVAQKLVTKGKLVNVEGKLVYRQYQNKEGATVYVTEVQAYKIEEVTASNK